MQKDFTANIKLEIVDNVKGKGFYENLLNFITSDFVVGIELVADDPI
jgi:hypothetical protein